MQPPTVDTAEQVAIFLSGPGKETARPIIVVHVRTGRNKFKVNPVTRHGRSKPSIFRGVLFRSQVAAATPGFITNTPETNAERFATRTLTARTPLRRSRRTRR